MSVELELFEVEFMIKVLSQITVSAAAEESVNVVSTVRSLINKLTKAKG